MLDLFKQATQSALAALGEGSLLRGTVPCQVNIEHGVQLTGLDSDSERASDTRVLLTSRSIATIDSTLNPKVGDALTHPDGSFKLDVMLEDSGAFRRFIVLKV